MVTVNHSDPTTRLLTEVECDRKISLCQRKLNLLKDLESADGKQIVEISAEKDIWERAKYHVQRGALITINDKEEIHLEEESSPTNNVN